MGGESSVLLLVEFGCHKEKQREESNYGNEAELYHNCAIDDIKIHCFFYPHPPLSTAKQPA